MVFLKPCYLLAFLALWALPCCVSAQDADGGPDAERPIQILNSDVLEFEERDGQKVRKLIGNVLMQQDSTLFFTDIAYQYEDKNVIDAQGRVRVLMGKSVTLTAKRLIYNGNTKVVELFDNIVLTEPPNVLTTERMIYYRNLAYGYYWGGGVLKDTANTLTSEVGYYYTQLRTARFARSVTLRGPDYRLNSDSLVYSTRTRTSYFVRPTHIATKDSAFMYTEGGYYSGKLRKGLFHDGPPWYRDSSYYMRADTLFYDDSLRFGWAHCNLMMRNNDSTLYIYGDTGTFFRRNSEVRVADHPYLISYMDKDTLVLMADTLYGINDSASKRKLVRAYHNAKLHTRDLQAIADSMVYDRTDSIFHFHQDPVLWSEANQITGDTIRVWIKKKQADSLAVLNKAFVISEEIPKRFYNQVRGKNLYASIDSNKITYIQVLGNAESIYFAKEGNMYSGMNQSTSIDMEVFLRNNKPRRIRFLRTPSGSFFPIHEIYFKPPKLEGFQWRPEERPRNYFDTTGWHLVPMPVAAMTDSCAAPDSCQSVTQDTAMHWYVDTTSARGNPPLAVDTTQAGRPGSGGGSQPNTNGRGANVASRHVPHPELTAEERATLKKAKKADRIKRKVARWKKKSLEKYQRRTERLLKKRARKQQKPAEGERQNLRPLKKKAREQPEPNG